MSKIQRRAKLESDMDNLVEHPIVSLVTRRGRAQGSSRHRPQRVSFRPFLISFHLPRCVAGCGMSKSNIIVHRHTSYKLHTEFAETQHCFF